MAPGLSNISVFVIPHQNFQGSVVLFFEQYNLVASCRGNFVALAGDGEEACFSPSAYVLRCVQLCNPMD